MIPELASFGYVEISGGLMLLGVITAILVRNTDVESVWQGFEGIRKYTPAVALVAGGAFYYMFKSGGIEAIIGNVASSIVTGLVIILLAAIGIKFR